MAYVKQGLQDGETFFAENLDYVEEGVSTAEAQAINAGSAAVQAMQAAQNAQGTADSAATAAQLAQGKADEAHGKAVALETNATAIGLTVQNGLLCLTYGQGGDDE